jgi:hypothetical protein
MDFLTSKIDASPRRNFRVNSLYIDEIIEKKYPQWKQWDVDFPIKNITSLPKISLLTTERINDDKLLFIGYDYHIDDELVGRIRLNRGIQCPDLGIHDIIGLSPARTPIMARNDIAPGRYLEYNEYSFEYVFEYVKHPTKQGWVVRHGEFVGGKYIVFGNPVITIKGKYNMGILQSYDGNGEDDENSEDGEDYENYDSVNALYDKEGYCIAYYYRDDYYNYLYQGDKERTISLIITPTKEFGPSSIEGLYNYNNLNSFIEGFNESGYDNFESFIEGTYEDAIYYRYYSNKPISIKDGTIREKGHAKASNSFVGVFVRDIMEHTYARPSRKSSGIIEYSIKTLMNGVRQGLQFSFKYRVKMDQLSHHFEIELIDKPSIDYYNNQRLVSSDEYKHYLEQVYYNPIKQFYIPEIAFIIVDYLGYIEVVSYQLVNSLITLQDSKVIFKKIPINTSYELDKTDD